MLEQEPAWHGSAGKLAFHFAPTVFPKLLEGRLRMNR